MHPDADYLKELENLTIELEKKIERVSILLKKILEDSTRLLNHFKRNS